MLEAERAFFFRRAALELSSICDIFSAEGLRTSITLVITKGHSEMIALLSGFLAVCIFFLIYPYLVYPIVIKAFPTRHVRRQAGHKCSATLMFCAYNEGSVVQEKIKNIERLKNRHSSLEVLAFDDGSDDDTFDQLSSRPDLLEVVRGGGRNGKAHGMKLLASMASGEILIFTDANVLLAEDAIEKLMAWYADPEVGGVCGTLKYLGDGNSTTASVGGAYWRLEERLKAEESRTGNVMGADGSIFSLRRALYPEFPDTVLDDLTVSMAAVFAGKRLIKVEDVVAYERLVVDRREEFSRKVRIAARAFHTHMYLRPQLSNMSLFDTFKYSSRKLIRWFGGAWLILSLFLTLVISAITSPLLGALAIMVVIAATFLGVKVNSGPIGAVTEVVLALMATLIGVRRAMKGQTFVTWSPAKSR